LRTRLAIVLALALCVGPVPGRAAETFTDADVYANVSADEVVLGNGLVERRWTLDAFSTQAIIDKRDGRSFGAHPDFSILLDGASVTSDRFSAAAVDVATLDRGGLGVTFTLTLAGLVTVERVVEAYPGVAGFSSRMTVSSPLPLVFSGYTLDEIAAGSEYAATVHAFRAGADWREEGWKPFAIGDPHLGDWRVEATAAAGQPLEAPGEWLSLTGPSGARVFMVMERRDYASSRMSFGGGTGSALVDLSRDIIYIGPFEESAHIENPTPLPARHRVIVPGRPLDLERVFTGLGSDGDDEPWQFSSYLAGHRLTPYPKAVTFNTNQVDENAISTGAKDDVDFERFQSLAAAAREMGVDTFIFDDGWQAASGDWCPDSADCPEPRWDGSPDSPHRPRFPDARFEAVRAVLAGQPGTADDMRLGLWMNPMEFHPDSDAFGTSPEWSCIPTGLATAIANKAQPDDGSNEAGIGVWNPEALGTHPETNEPMKLIDYMESRIVRMIEEYGATYFKFDFLVWIDCVGLEPVDMYGYRDSFVAMMDRLQAAHPEVTYEIDETNDYRLFPFESVARGPSWFQNGTPEASQLLHNIWNLAPYVPGYSLGQHAIGNGAELASLGVDRLMAVALGSHITFWSEIDAELSAAQRAQVKRWTDFYKANRDVLATFTYPLLDDPASGGWTALQPWNPETGEGFLLAYRQSAPEQTRTIALRGVRGEGSFALTLIDPATGAASSLGTATADALRAGIEVTIPDANGYAIIRLAPVA
jgi:hypothetical protein